MSSQKTGFPLAKKAYNQAKQSFKKNPSLFAPFLTFAIIEFLALIVIYLAPRMPLKLLFGPPIRTFWGERFLHYPLNFLLLPKLTSLSRMGLSILFGSLLTGMAVVLACDAFNHKRLEIGLSLKSALKKYVSLFILVLIITLLVYFLMKIITAMLLKYFMAGHSKLLFIGARLWMGPILICINFVLALFIQSAFMYAIPILMIEKEKLIKAIGKSFVLFGKLFIPTLALVGIPMLLYIPVMVLNYNTAFLIQEVAPEAVLWVAILSVIISSLVIDAIVTVGTTMMYLTVKEVKP